MTNIINFFSNLTNGGIYVLIAFVILTIINNFFTIGSIMRVAGAESYASRITDLTDFSMNVIFQMIITALFAIIFIQTSALNIIIMTLLTPIVILIELFALTAICFI